MLKSKKSKETLNISKSTLETLKEQGAQAMAAKEAMWEAALKHAGKSTEGVKPTVSTLQNAAATNFANEFKYVTASAPYIFDSSQIQNTLQPKAPPTPQLNPYCKTIRDVIEQLAYVGFVAGGAARYLYMRGQATYNPSVANDHYSWLLPSDIDVYFYTLEGFEVAHNILTKHLKYTLATSTKNAATYFPHSYVSQTYIPVQLIKPVEETATHNKTYGTVEDVIDLFGFTVEQFAAEFTEGEIEFTTSQEAKDDVQYKRLRIHSVCDPITLAYRVNKYGVKGFSIPLAEIPKIFLAWEALPVDLKEQLLLEASQSPVTSSGGYNFPKTKGSNTGANYPPTTLVDAYEASTLEKELNDSYLTLDGLADGNAYSALGPLAISWNESGQAIVGVNDTTYNIPIHATISINKDGTITHSSTGDDAPVVEHPVSG